jgi:CheY-like chemotaxis protein
MTKKHPRILVVEDERSLNEVYQLILNREGYEVRAAYDGASALEITAEWQPDLILLDLRMPNMDGNKFLQQYDLAKHPHVRVVIFSNYDTQPEIEEAYKHGADRFILKAMASPRELVKIVEDTLASVKTEEPKS